MKKLALQNSEPENESWDFKKIVIGIVVVGVVIFGFYYYRTSWLPYFETISSQIGPKRVKGAQTAQDEKEQVRSLPSSVDIQKNVQNRLDTLKKEVLSLNAADIATSSPQFQKVSKDLEALKSLPRNQAKQYCEQICSSF